MKLYLIWTTRDQKNPWRIVAENLGDAVRAWRANRSHPECEEPDRIELKDPEVIVATPEQPK